MSELFVHDRGTRVVVRGIDALFRPGVPRPLRVDLRDQAAAQGVRRVGGETPPPVEDAAPSVETIRDALQAILARGRKGDVTRAGNVRMEVLEAELGYNVSTSDRDAAMALIPAGD